MDAIDCKNISNHVLSFAFFFKILAIDCPKGTVI